LFSTDRTDNLPAGFIILNAWEANSQDQSAEGYVTVGIALGAAVATLGVRASRLPSNADPLTPRQKIEINGWVMQHFHIIFGIEIAAIVLASVALKAIQYPDFILSGVALIVAVHFFPLAVLFHAPVYYGTALGGSAVGLGGFFMTDAVLRQKVVGLSFGILLWATAAWIARLGLSATAL
jgi:hypothetical protein